jgi:hypothetical protein
MKKGFISLLIILGLHTTNAQVGIGIALPHTSAQLDITATNKGVLIPRITQANRPMAPATGLLIYQTDGAPGFYYYDGSSWQSLNKTGWNLTGNSGTTDGQFIGTTDNRPLLFKVQDQWAGQISASATTLSLGFQAAAVNTGVDNTAIGYQALPHNTTGSRNTGIGYQALMTNTGGGYNTGLGWRSLYSNTSGGYNTALGNETLLKNSSGNDNTALGYQTLLNNSSGTGNTAVGNKTIQLNTTGGYNAAVGYEALNQNTTGSNNIALGQRAMYTNSTGHTNIAIGFRAGSIADNISASIAIGANASPNSLSATAIGENATISSEASNAIAIGSNARINSSFTALGSIAIGANAAVHTPAHADVSNSIALGSGVIVNNRNTVIIGNTTISTISGKVNWTTYSDGRFKEAVKENVPGLAFIKQLRPVSYVVNNASLNKYYYKDHPSLAAAIKFNESGSSKRETGFIAQEVEKAAQALGYEFSGVDAPADKDGLYGLRYSEFVVPLVKAVQEQQNIIETQGQRIEKLEKQVSALLNAMEKMKAK